MRVSRTAVRRVLVTEVFVGSVALTTLILAALGKDEQQRLMLLTSTNLHGLAHRPLLVLLTSVFWSTPGGLVTTIAPAAVVMGLVEWRIGSLRTLCVLAAGHVGATLLTASGIAAGVSLGMLPAAAGRAVDVGVSYAVMAVIGFAAGLVVGQARLVVGAMLVALLMSGVALDRDFTSFGHLFAALIGVALAFGGLGTARPRMPRLAVAIVAALVVAAPFTGYVEVFTAEPVAAHAHQHGHSVRKAAPRIASSVSKR